MQRPVVPPIGKAHAEDHGHPITDGDQHAHRGLVELLHLQQAGDHVGFDGDDGHGNGMVQDDDASFALRLHQVHAENADDKITHTEFGHRSGEHAEQRRLNGDHRNGDQDQALGRAEKIS